MNTAQFLDRLEKEPTKIQFSDTMELIDSNYDFTPCKFTNGTQLNEANQNNGSCKLLAFAKLHNLSTEQTLQCFGDYYRIDVLQRPENNDHQNIRNLILNGLDGVKFHGQPLVKKI